MHAHLLVLNITNVKRNRKETKERKRMLTEIRKQSFKGDLYLLLLILKDDNILYKF